VVFFSLFLLYSHGTYSYKEFCFKVVVRVTDLCHIGFYLTSEVPSPDWFVWHIVQQLLPK
jgi:hypothetical protein